MKRLSWKMSRILRWKRSIAWSSSASSSFTFATAMSLLETAFVAGARNSADGVWGSCSTSSWGLWGGGTSQGGRGLEVAGVTHEVLRHDTVKIKKR